MQNGRWGEARVLWRRPVRSPTFYSLPRGIPLVLTLYICQWNMWTWSDWMYLPGVGATGCWRRRVISCLECHTEASASSICLLHCIPCSLQNQCVVLVWWRIYISSPEQHDMKKTTVLDMPVYWRFFSAASLPSFAYDGFLVIVPQWLSHRTRGVEVVSHCTEDTREAPHQVMRLSSPSLVKLQAYWMDLFSHLP